MEMDHSIPHFAMKKQPVRRLDGCTFIRVFVRCGMCVRGAVKYTHHVLVRFHARLVGRFHPFQRVKWMISAALLIFSHT